MSEQEDREALYDLWSRHGSSWESDSSEGRELADAIVAAGFRRPEPVTRARLTSEPDVDRRSDRDFDIATGRPLGPEPVTPETVTGETSDGHHTFNELYEYRMLYHAHAVRGWLNAGIPVVKSWRHSDGELAFGGGWFIVSAQLATGQVTNHYRAEHWEIFDVPEVEQAPEYDGHTPQDVAHRLRDAFAEPVTPAGNWDCPTCGNDPEDCYCSDPEPVTPGKITIRAPHVPYGPKGIPQRAADADYLREAAKHIEGGYPVGGSNLTATVIALLRDVADALVSEPVIPETETEWGLRDNKLGSVTTWGIHKHPLPENFPGYTIVTRECGPWLPVEDGGEN